MPDHWTGTVEQRFAKLEREGRRCDGNNRRCTHGAIEEYALRPAQNYRPIPDGELIHRRSCSRHKPQFISSGSYLVVSSRRFPRMHVTA